MKILGHVSTYPAKLTPLYDKFWNSFRSLDLTGLNVDFLITPTSPYEPYPHRAWSNDWSYKMERARQILLKNNYDILFNLECDHVFKPETLKRLLSTFYKHKLKCLSALYRLRPNKHRNPPAPLCGKANGEWFDDSITQERGLIQTDLMGFGCCLIAKEVLEKVGFDNLIDASFAEKVRELNIKMYIDLDVRIGHITENEVLYP